MEPCREIEVNGYKYALKANQLQYKCISCTSTFSLNNYSARSGHTNRCRDSKHSHKLKRKKKKKILKQGSPIRIPTKHFIKEKTPENSVTNSEEEPDVFSNSKSPFKDPIIDSDSNKEKEEESIKTSQPTSSITDAEKDVKATLDRIYQRRKETHLKNEKKVTKKK